MNTLQVKIIAAISPAMLERDLNKWLVDSEEEDFTILKISYTHTITKYSENEFVAYIEYKN